MQNKSTNQLIGLGILALVVIFILYEIWPYLVDQTKKHKGK